MGGVPALALLTQGVARTRRGCGGTRRLVERQAGPWGGVSGRGYADSGVVGAPLSPRARRTATIAIARYPNAATFGAMNASTITAT